MLRYFCSSHAKKMVTVKCDAHFRLHYCQLSVLWRRWLGGRKGIRPVKTECWGAGVVVYSEVQTCIWPSWCHCYSMSLASVKSRLVLPFWYWLTRVVPDKGLLNGCVCVVSAVMTQEVFLKILLHVKYTWTCIWPRWCHCHSPSLAWVKSRFVLPFWYWLTRG